MDFKHRLERSFKPRFAIIYPFGVFFLLFGSIDAISLRCGIGYVITGLLIRLWSNGYAIKNDKLTTSGPYGLVRNPLYLGTFLIAIGFAFMLNLNLPIMVSLIIKILFLASLVYVYTSTVKNEEGMLLKRFGKNFQDYCNNVPAIIPRLTPYTEGEKWPFDMDRLIFSKEYKSLFWITIIIIGFHLKSRILVEQKAMTSNSWGLVLLAAILIMLDVFYEINKKKKK